MSGDRLTPEERAVIEAAVGWTLALAEDDATEAALLDAVTTYRKATAPPEPFEAALHGADEYTRDPENGYWYIDLHVHPHADDDEVWRCTVTPIERVR